MKVKCIQVIDEMVGDKLPASPWLTVGRAYIVLAVFQAARGVLKFRLIGDDGLTPALHDARQFEVLCPRIPSGWIVDFVPDKHFELTPLAWSSQGFWQDYFDGQAAAVSLFEREKKILLDEYR